MARALRCRRCRRAPHAGGRDSRAGLLSHLVGLHDGVVPAGRRRTPFSDGLSGFSGRFPDWPVRWNRPKVDCFWVSWGTNFWLYSWMSLWVPWPARGDAALLGDELGRGVEPNSIRAFFSKTSASGSTMGSARRIPPPRSCGSTPPGSRSAGCSGGGRLDVGVPDDRDDPVRLTLVGDPLRELLVPELAEGETALRHRHARRHLLVRVDGSGSMPKRAAFMRFWRMVTFETSPRGGAGA